MHALRRTGLHNPINTTCRIRTNRRVLVFAGSNDDTYDITGVLQATQFKVLLKDSIVLRLEDDLTNLHPDVYQDAKAFRSTVFATGVLPTVRVCSCSGLCRTMLKFVVSLRG